MQKAEGSCSSASCQTVVMFADDAALYVTLTGILHRWLRSPTAIKNGLTSLSHFLKCAVLYKNQTHLITSSHLLTRHSEECFSVLNQL